MRFINDSILEVQLKFQEAIAYKYILSDNNLIIKPLISKFDESFVYKINHISADSLILFPKMKEDSWLFKGDTLIKLYNKKCIYNDTLKFKDITINSLNVESASNGIIGFKFSSNTKFIHYWRSLLERDDSIIKVFVKHDSCMYPDNIINNNIELLKFSQLNKLRWDNKDVVFDNQNDHKNWYISLYDGLNSKTMNGDLPNTLLYFWEYNMEFLINNCLSDSVASETTAD